MANSLELLLVEQFLTNLTNSKLKFDVVAKPTISDNEDFFHTRMSQNWNMKCNFLCYAFKMFLIHGNVKLIYFDL